MHQLQGIKQSYCCICDVVAKFCCDRRLLLWRHAAAVVVPASGPCLRKQRADPHLHNDLKLITVWPPYLVFVRLRATRSIQHLGVLLAKHKLETHSFKTTLSCKQQAEVQGSSMVSVPVDRGSAVSGRYVSACGGQRWFFTLCRQVQGMHNTVTEAFSCWIVIGHHDKTDSEQREAPALHQLCKPCALQQQPVSKAHFNTATTCNSSNPMQAPLKVLAWLASCQRCCCC